MDESSSDSPVIGKCRRIGRETRGLFQALGVDVGEGDDFRVIADPNLIHQFQAAVAHADDADPQAVAGAQSSRGYGGQGTGQSGGNFAQEFAARIHPT